MTARLCCVLAALAVIAAPARNEERPSKREQDARKDLLELQGTWQLQSVEDGKDAKVNVKKRTLFVGGDLVLVQDGDKLVQAGQLRLNTTKAPRGIDVIVRKGEHADNTMLGIYELKGDVLKVCFDPEGESRPKKFEAKKDAGVFVATYKRVKRDGEEIDVRGRYRSESFGPDKKKVTMEAEIVKRGDAYLMKWEVSEGVAYLGTGIRQGDTLSVAWVNRGSVGLSVYKIEKGPKLVGVYTEVGGAGLVAKEVLTISKSADWVEARLR
jgi:uncharacterized protein (TIGR03067 family)